MRIAAGRAIRVRCRIHSSGVLYAQGGPHAAEQRRAIDRAHRLDASRGRRAGRGAVGAQGWLRMRLEDEGHRVLVHGVIAGGPAAKGGLRKGDEVTKLDGQ
jgi:S1-C subfamily serine protease